MFGCLIAVANGLRGRDRANARPLPVNAWRDTRLNLGLSWPHPHFHTAQSRRVRLVGLQWQ